VKVTELVEKKESTSMEFVGSLQFLWAIFKKSKTFHEFINQLISAEKTEILTQIGDTHWAAALEHLSNVDSNNETSRSEVFLAIGAFEQAYQLYMHARPKGLKISRSIELMFIWNTRRRQKCCLSACAVSLLQSRCYKYLHEPERVQKYVERARDCFEEYAGLRISIANSVKRYLQSQRYYGYRDPIMIVIDEEMEIEKQRKVFQKIIEYLSGEEGSPPTHENDEEERKNIEGKVELQPPPQRFLLPDEKQL
jgi:tRNA nucleotidyltransferase/poly(A) polymerase